MIDETVKFKFDINGNHAQLLTEIVSTCFKYKNQPSE